MSAIAKEAKTGMGTIYNYYPTKEHLINDIYIDIKQKEESLFDHFSNEVPIKTQFEKHYTTTVMFFIDNPLYFSFMDQLHASPIITEESRQTGRKAVDCVRELLEVGKNDRIIKNISTKELMQFTGGAVFSFVRWYLADNTEGKQLSLTNQMKMLWDAIKE